MASVARVTAPGVGLVDAVVNRTELAMPVAAGHDPPRRVI